MVSAIRQCRQGRSLSDESCDIGVLSTEPGRQSFALESPNAEVFRPGHLLHYPHNAEIPDSGWAAMCRLRCVDARPNPRTAVRRQELREDQAAVPPSWA